MDHALEQKLNLLLESERAGVAALDGLIAEVEQDRLRRFLGAAREEEVANARELERLIVQAGGTPSAATGPFAEKVAALESLRDRLNLMSRGQEWVARKIEEALLLAPESGPIRQSLARMANRHRFEVEWGRAEVIRLLSAER